jgi:hypothetical protein
MYAVELRFRENHYYVFEALFEPKVRLLSALGIGCGGLFQEPQ